MFVALSVAGAVGARLGRASADKADDRVITQVGAVEASVPGVSVDDEEAFARASLEKLRKMMES